MHRVTSLAFATGLLCAACSDKPKTFETSVVLARTQVVQTGRGKIIDVELEYSECPGEQQEIFQGDASFAECMAKYKPGEKLAATIVYSRLPDGHYDSEVTKIGDCGRKRDVNDDRSYELVHECHDIVVNGVPIGFHCDHKPTKELLSKCPWFKRS
jgi:hypothetical protein